MPGIEGFKFEAARDEDKSLHEIKQVQRVAKQDLKQHINDTIIDSLNGKGLEVVAGDELAQINALTLRGNRLSFNTDADHIEIGDIITIQNGKVMRNSDIVGEVVQGFNISTVQAIASVKNDITKIIPKKTKQKPANENTRINQSVETNNNHDGLVLANYIKKRGYPIWKSGAYCGQNVGNMLSQFGSPQLPTWGRDGHKWTGFLDGNPGFIKERISSPMEAKAGGICVYDKGYGYTQEREDYGHVEIALGGGDFYYGHKRNRPGGSIDAARHPTKSGFTGYVYYPVTSKFDDMLMVS